MNLIYDLYGLTLSPGRYIYLESYDKEEDAQNRVRILQDPVTGAYEDVIIKERHIVLTPVPPKFIDQAGIIIIES